MPYIKQERRNEILSGDEPMNAGELNFAITSVLIDATTIKDPAERYPVMVQGADVLCTRYMSHEGFGYKDINDVIGALHCAAREYRRRTGDAYLSIVFANHAAALYDRHAVPYEIRKIEENGDLPYVPVPR